MSGDLGSGRAVLLAGCGDIGGGLGRRLLGIGATVAGLRRRPDRLPDGFERLAGDFSDPASLSHLDGRRFDAVVVTLTPTSYTDQAYAAAYVDGLRNLLSALTVRPGLLVFVSSTSVYPQDDHKWVDENSPTEPTSFAGVQMLRAEELVAASGVPHVNARASGIYGPGRTRLLDQVRAGRVCGPADRIYTNRIHRDDLVGFLEHLLRQQWSAAPLHSLYLVTDSHPATMWDVQSWLARRIGRDPFSLQTAPVTGRTSKRCRNTRLRDSGYTLRYPDFMGGYGALLDEPGAHSGPGNPAPE